MPEHIHNHHFGLSKCPKSWEIKLNFQHIREKQFECFNPSEPLHYTREDCLLFIVSSVKSDEPIIFPYFTGIFINDFSYYLLEGHFRNSFNKEIEFKPIFRIWITSN